MAGRKPSEADGTLTVQCEWFPVEAAAARRPDPWRRGEETWLETEARLFGAAVRTVFNRLVEAMARKPESATTVETAAERAAASRLEWKRRLQTDFGLNRRSADDAILRANEVIASQRARIPLEIKETEVKRDRTEQKRKAERLEAGKP